MTQRERWALVTGATRGIGRAVVERMLRAGTRVIACARDGDALEALATTRPGRVFTLPLDLAQPGAADALCARALSHAPGLDQLVCAAGIVQYTPLGSIREAELRAQLEVNFVAPFLIAQRLGLHMRDQGRGAIVLVASTLGQQAAPNTAAYAASKAALISATRSLAIEFAPSVRCNAVAPGVVDTDMIRVARPGADASASAIAEQTARLAALHPLQRLGQPDEVAQAVMFLLEASWITGSVLTVDGGLTA